YVAQALREGFSVADVHHYSAIDPWFIEEIAELVAESASIAKAEAMTDAQLAAAKAHGFGDRYLAQLTGATEAEVRERRHQKGIRPVYKRVDTCAAEFEAYTPYLYSAYEDEDEAPPSQKKKVLILGSGPIRIGQ